MNGTLASMAAGWTAIVNPALKLIGGFAYVTAVLFILIAAFLLKEHAKMSRQTMMRQPGRGPMKAALFAMAAFLLLAMPASMDAGQRQTFGSANKLSYSGSAGKGAAGASGDVVVQAALSFLQVLGYIAFFRGIYLIPRLDLQQHSGWSAGTFMIGGILAANPVAVATAIEKQFHIHILH